MVVGGGIAGLWVTTQLAAAGIGVVCLEARDRVGGRLLSAGLGAASFDLGATWCWPGEHRVQNLCATLRLGVFDAYAAGDAIHEPAGGAYRLNGNPVGVPAYRFAGGAHGLARALADRLPATRLRLDSPVSAVSTVGGSLVVTAGQEEIRARHVVLAVPPALVASSMLFDPPLPPALHRAAASTPVWMGATTKVVVHYPEPFWRGAGLAGVALSTVGPLQEVHDLSGPAGQPAALFGFAFGAGAVGEGALAQLVRLFGPQAAAPVGVIAQDWSAERYTSPHGVARLDDYRWFGHPLYSQGAWDGRLHWASTETSIISPGHIEGALAAAERAAQAVMAAIL